MINQDHDAAASRRNSTIDHNASAPPVAVPPGYVGELVIPGTGRRVWWTGRVAIGLLHQPAPRSGRPAESAHWVQELMLGKPGRVRPAHA